MQTFVHETSNILHAAENLFFESANFRARTFCTPKNFFSSLQTFVYEKFTSSAQTFCTPKSFLSFANFRERKFTSYAQTFCTPKTFLSFANFRARNFKHSTRKHFARRKLFPSLQTFVHETSNIPRANILHAENFF